MPRTASRKTRHHGPIRRVVIFGRCAPALDRELGDLTGFPVIELDTKFWQPGLTRAEHTGWAVRQRELCSRDTWIIDGDLGPYDQDLGMRLCAADTIIVLPTEARSRRCWPGTRFWISIAWAGST